MYYKIFKTGLASQLEYRINFITSFLFSLIPFAANALLWIAAAHQNKRMTVNINGIISYYFVILIVSNITSTSSAAEISEDIRLGGLNKHLLKPYNYALYKLVLELPKRFIFIIMNFIPL
uniref:ABC-2 family transporter protein n=1 Tax=Treponema pedis TaxID=409322 RepID=UPI00056EA823